jgi:TFIIIC subunit triple barrel domain
VIDRRTTNFSKPSDHCRARSSTGRYDSTLGTRLQNRLRRSRSAFPSSLALTKTSYITLDFTRVIAPPALKPTTELSFTVPAPPRLPTLIQGLDTETPYVQVGERYYRGQWTELLGTEMIVRRGSNSEGMLSGDGG